LRAINPPVRILAGRLTGGKTMDMKINTVLVGLDGLPRAEPALRVGLELARVLGASPSFVHAVPVPMPVWPDIDTTRFVELNEASVEAARGHMQMALTEMVGDGLPGPLGDCLRVIPGYPSRVLVDRAEELDADLIVLGSHKKRSLVDFGSTARGVLSQVHCSVWVQPCKFDPVRRILAPLDLSEHSLEALRMAVMLASSIGARVDTLYCFDAPEYSWGGIPGYPDAVPAYLRDESLDAVRGEYERVLAEFDWNGVEHQQHFAKGPPVPGILARQGDYDLIALGTHGRTGFSAAVLGSVAYACLKQSHLPVLAIRHPERCWTA
jgi:nucleotide-binding universal stress UspA family protein